MNEIDSAIKEYSRLKRVCETKQGVQEKVCRFVA